VVKTERRICSAVFINGDLDVKRAEGKEHDESAENKEFGG